jgi:hypothetical protein
VPGGDGGTGAQGGAGAQAGVGAQGGTLSKGGSTSAGGRAGGPSPVGGSGNGTTGGTGGAGEGGSGAADVCELPADPGQCLALFSRYYYDPNTEDCRPFDYGGCDGNENNFESRAACLARCSLGKDRTACESPAECTLVDAVCCACGATLAEVTAVNRSYDEEFPGILRCPELPCAPCPEPGYSKWLAATCDSGHCVAFDARENPITECVDDADCVLRGGLDCCGCGSDIVSVNRGFDLEQLFCAEGGCAADCAPNIPPDSHAICRQGRCDITVVLP